MVVRDNELTMSILGVIERIGNKDDLESVAAVATAEARDETSESVRLAAERSLAALHARITEQSKSETLLRPSEPSDSSLLRAVPGSAPSSEHQALIRPVE